jgi:hypothetical protein
MNEIPKVITTHMKRILAYAEGREAFEAKRWRAFNPYKDTLKELASNWWNGWDQANAESKKPVSHQP